MNKKTKEFLQKLKEIGHWNDDYDYSKVEFTSSKNKILLINNKFNTEHLIIPQTLLSRNTKCSIHNAKNKNVYLANQFKEIHGDKFDYSMVEYKGHSFDVDNLGKR